MEALAARYPRAVRSELLQAGRIALWQAGTRYRPSRGRFKPYAQRTIAWAIQEAARAQDPFARWRQPPQQVGLSAARGVVEGGGVEQALENFFSALPRLSPAQRQVIAGLCRPHGQEALAKALGVSPGRLSQRKAEAKAALAAQLG